jgi:SAM-dependent methyltransferase
MMSDFEFSCPACGSSLVALSSDLFYCPKDRTRFQKENGIWRFLTPDRELVFRQFIQDYETIRCEEGRGSEDPEYYRSLPFKDKTGLHSRAWKIRAISYRYFERCALVPLEKKFHRSLKILDLGAGNGWLSSRLAGRGHQVAAVDLLVNKSDGLGAWKNYQGAFTPVQAEYDCLPFRENQMDLAVFNASFHYSLDYEVTLKEVLRVLRLGSPVVILDTPVYHNSQSGKRMVIEREADFYRRYGFASNALPSENFLTYQRLEKLAERLFIHWDYHFPFYGFSWVVRPLWARLRGYREPARFVLLLGVVSGFGVYG